jgi:hypothetical protein
MYIFYPIVDIVKYLCIIYYLPLLLFSDFYFHSSFCFYQTDYQNIDYNVQQKICDMVYYSFLALLSSPQTIQNENWLISHINNLNCSKIFYINIWWNENLLLRDEQITIKILLVGIVNVTNSATQKKK